MPELREGARGPGSGPARGSLHHVALGARDVEAVAAFYRDLLGLAEVARHRDPAGGLRSVWLSLRPGLLMVERTGRPLRRVATVAAGPFLLAFAVDARERLAREAALIAAGFPVESRTEHTSYFRDPEGNRVGISSYPVPIS